jgi:hypothetical protein
MTTTIFGKKLLMIATITVMLSGLMLVTTLDDAEAKKAKTGEHKLKCKSDGSFFPPSPDVFSSSEGKCSAGLGHVSTASISSAAAGVTPGCLTLTSTGMDFAIGKKNFIMLTSTGEQCFKNESGDPIAFTGIFCVSGDPTSAFTSEVVGTYAIHGGLVKKTPVVGGSGDFVSKANHCAGDTAPFGNSFNTKLEGTIVFP